MKMALSKYFCDLLLVPLGICLTMGYHLFLWHSFKNKQQRTTVEADFMRRKIWVVHILQSTEKKAMLAVQSLRNAIMASILSATVAVILNIALAALSNNTYNGSRLLQNSFLFGSQSRPLLALKYASSSLILMTSFLFSSMATVEMIDASFHFVVPADFSPGVAQSRVERGQALGMAGIRVLYVAVPMLLWLLGPLPMVISSFGLVWVLYVIDFCG